MVRPEAQKRSRPCIDSTPQTRFSLSGGVLQFFSKKFFGLAAVHFTDFKREIILKFFGKIYE
jgi:hypothetical protein